MRYAPKETRAQKGSWKKGVSATMVAVGLWFGDLIGATYDWDDLVLDLAGEGDQLEETGEVELGVVVSWDGCACEGVRSGWNVRRRRGGRGRFVVGRASS